MDMFGLWMSYTHFVLVDTFIAVNIFFRGGNNYPGRQVPGMNYNTDRCNNHKYWG